MNFQNIPRKEKVVKRAFVPKLDALFYFDYSQIEFLLLAYYCYKLGDTSMVDVLKRGDDLHTETAIGALNIEGEVEDWQRQLGKNINYSLIYGGGRPAIRRYASCDWQRAGELLDGFHRRWPGVQVMIDAINEKLERRGYITTLWGRHLRPESPHKALNALIQGCAADLMKSSMVKVDDYCKREQTVSHIVSTVHDEIQMDVWDLEIKEIVREVPFLMDHPPISEVIQIEVDVEWTRTNWAEKEKFVRD